MTEVARLRRWWDAFWFTPASATNLGAVRVVVAVHALWILLSRDYAGIARAPAVFRSTIPDDVRWRYLIFEGGGDLDRAVQTLAILSLVLVLIGVAPRVAALLAAVSIYHLAPLETAMWTPSPYGRGMTLAPIALVILAAARSGDALSLGRRVRAPERSWEYRWPLQLLGLLVVQIYLFSAIGKLGTAGLDWGSAENVRRWLLLFNTTSESSPFSFLGLWIADHPSLCAAIGVGTVLFEWSVPVALFWPASRVALIGMAMLFHVGTLLMMNIYVGEAWYLLVFVDWAWLGARVRRPLRAPLPSTT